MFHCNGEKEEKNEGRAPKKIKQMLVFELIYGL